MYFLWVGEEPLPAFISHSCVRIARTPKQAEKMVREFGYPLIISFGKGSVSFAVFISINKARIPVGFTYRIHHHFPRHRKAITEIMKDV